MLSASYNIQLCIKSNTKSNDDLSLSRQKDLTSIRKSSQTRKTEKSFRKTNQKSQIMNIIQKKEISTSKKLKTIHNKIILELLLQRLL